MKLKIVNYILSPLVLLLLLSGCGSSSSSETQPNSRLSDQGEKVAIYISMEELEAQKALSKATNTTPSFSKSSKLIKENAERENLDGQWIVYDKSPTGAGISIKYDDVKESRVIELNGNGLQNGYVLGYWAKPGSWNDKSNKIIQWSMSYSEDYYIYVRVSTEKGYRYLYYTPSDNNYGIAELYDAPHYIHHGLGSNSTDGSWKTFTRDLEADLKEFDPTNTLISVDGFFVRGSGRIDDVALLSKKETPPVTTPSIDDAIEAWLTAHTSTKNKIILNKNKTRAVVYAYTVYYNTTYPYATDTTYIFNISNLNNIKKLAEKEWFHRNQPKHVKIKENDYILLLRAEEILLYDFTTGELLSSHSISFEDVYIKIEENYIIIDDYGFGYSQTKFDFTDRRNPIITTM